MGARGPKRKWISSAEKKLRSKYHLLYRRGESGTMSQKACAVALVLGSRGQLGKWMEIARWRLTIQIDNGTYIREIESEWDAETK